MTHMPHLNEIELPERREDQVAFWSSGDQYWIRCHSAGSWSLVGPRGSLRGSFIRRSDGYAVMDEYDGLDVERFADWRGLVMTLA